MVTMSLVGVPSKMCTHTSSIVSMYRCNLSLVYNSLLNRHCNWSRTTISYRTYSYSNTNNNHNNSGSMNHNQSFNRIYNSFDGSMLPKHHAVATTRYYSRVHNSEDRYKEEVEFDRDIFEREEEEEEDYTMLLPLDVESKILSNLLITIAIQNRLDKDLLQQLGYNIDLKQSTLDVFQDIIGIMEKRGYGYTEPIYMKLFQAMVKRANNQNDAMVDRAISLFEDKVLVRAVQNEGIPSPHSFHLLIKSLLEFGKLELFEKYWIQMREMGVEPVPETIAYIITHFSRVKGSIAGLKFLKECIQMYPSSSTSNLPLQRMAQSIFQYHSNNNINQNQYNNKAKRNNIEEQQKNNIPTSVELLETYLLFLKEIKVLNISILTDILAIFTNSAQKLLQKEYIDIIYRYIQEVRETTTSKSIQNHLEIPIQHIIHSFINVNDSVEVQKWLDEMEKLNMQPNPFLFKILFRYYLMTNQIPQFEWLLEKYHLIHGDDFSRIESLYQEKQSIASILVYLEMKGNEETYTHLVNSFYEKARRSLQTALEGNMIQTYLLLGRLDLANWWKSYGDSRKSHFNTTVYYFYMAYFHYRNEFQDVQSVEKEMERMGLSPSPTLWRSVYQYYKRNNAEYLTNQKKIIGNISQFSKVNKGLFGSRR